MAVFFVRASVQRFTNFVLSKRQEAVHTLQEWLVEDGSRAKLDVSRRPLLVCIKKIETMQSLISWANQVRMRHGRNAGLDLHLCDV